jgi:hypothetical protein
MRSRAEWLLRGAAIALLTWVLWAALRPPAATSGWADSRTLPRALVRWTVASPPPTSAHVVIDDSAGLPAYAGQWLAALGRTGTHVSWSAPRPLPATAIELDPVADPRGATLVRVAAPAGATVTLRDALGPYGPMTAGTAVLHGTVGTLDAVVGGMPARGLLRDSLTLRRILVLGRAGWESKFAIRALEEEGWFVDAKLRVTPTLLVTQGRPTAPDTARYAAVVVVDSVGRALAGATGAAERYVRSGGGLIAEAGIRETWRWRMAGGDSGVARHRAWWAARVAGIAYAPATDRGLSADPASVHADPAPLAHLIDALGSPISDSKAATVMAHPTGSDLDPTRSPWIFGALLATLLLEWASRRLRGKP